MIYFDNSATTKILDPVQLSRNQVELQFFGNPSSLHQEGVKSKQILTKAREQIANLLKVNTDEILFTSGGTESNNTAIIGTVLEKRIYGNHIITSQIEHPSVMNAMKFLETLGYEVTYLPVDKNGIINMSDLEEALRTDTILISIMWVNNEVGSIQPIELISELLKSYPNIHFHVDAVQASELVLSQGIFSRIDLLSLSAHKFHGPRGVGLLYKKINRKIKPILLGGGQENNLRSGTENVSGIVAMSKALRIHAEKESQIVLLKNELIHFLNNFKKVTIFTPQQSIDHILTFAIEGIRGEVLVHALEQYNIFLSTTSACSSKVKQEHHTLGAMGVPKKLSQCAVRLSFSKYNTQEEVSKFKEIFERVYENFEKISN